MDSNFDMSQLSPEQIQSLMELGLLDEQNGQLEEQLQQAQALAKPSGRQHTTAAGALIGGLGDIINQGMGDAQEQKLRKQQAGLLDQKRAGRRTFADLLSGVGRPPTPPPLDVPAGATPFGYGGDEPDGPGPDEREQPVPFGYSPGMWRQGPLRRR